jgi:hypothetical protein
MFRALKIAVACVVLLAAWPAALQAKKPSLVVYEHPITGVQWASPAAAC